ncbi:IclR family transcriptional regulator [Gordonia sp. NPDC127522]|uniref:IclR family transcriptional regulator n=1 Tax=Gordonia sp. NPDC127522 TaxID=3345390 RepID=UPI0036370783
MSNPGSAEPGFDSSTVLGKVMVTLHSFRIDDAALSFSEIQRRTGIAKGTLHRVLGDMVEVRLLDRADDGYRLGGQLFELGMRASVGRGLLELAIPFLEDLYVRTRETVHLGVLDGNEVMYLSKIGGHRQAAAPSKLGGRMPVHCTAIGKVLLAHAAPDVRNAVLAGPLPRHTPHTIVHPGVLNRQLERIVVEGVAFEAEESTLGIVCVAAPVRLAGGDAIAAISVTGPAVRFDPAAHAASVRAAANELGNVLTRRERLSDR